MLAATVESWVSTRYAYMGSSVIWSEYHFTVAEFGANSATFWGGALGSFEGEVVER